MMTPKWRWTQTQTKGTRREDEPREGPSSIRRRKKRRDTHAETQSRLAAPSGRAKPAALVGRVDEISRMSVAARECA